MFLTKIFWWIILERLSDFVIASRFQPKIIEPYLVVLLINGLHLWYKVLPRAAEQNHTSHWYDFIYNNVKDQILQSSYVSEAREIQITQVYALNLLNLAFKFLRGNSFCNRLCGFRSKLVFKNKHDKRGVSGHLFLKIVTNFII